MKKHTIVLAILVFSLTLLAQEIQHEAVAVNIEVSVRVYKGKTFIDNLTIDDFEIYEDGVLQKIEAVYLIKKTTIEREEKPELEPEKIVPEVSRHFLILFELIDHFPQLEEVLDEFFLNVLLPEDSLIVVTPLNTYNLKDGAFAMMPKDQLARGLYENVRKDVIKGNAHYKSLISQLSSPLNTSALRRNILKRIMNYKQFNEQGFLQFAEYMKGLAGQKHVFLFYQKEGIPMSSSISAIYKFGMMKRANFYEDRVIEAFSDSSISVHFLYITKEHTAAYGLSDPRLSGGTEIVDLSELIVNTFREMAHMTGGITESSTNISWSFNQAVQASENYYLLYYKPQNYIVDGKFKKIKVNVKGQNYRIIHRSGYVAD